MQATLIYNPNSRAAKDIKAEDMLKALTEAGYEPNYRETKSESDLDQILKDVDGLIVTAGGDGTIRAVVTRMVGREIRIAPLPLGTSNNICKTLNHSGDPIKILKGLNDPIKCPFDIGKMTGPWGEDYFLEAAGYGLYAEILSEYKPEEGKSVLRSIKAIREAMDHYRAHYNRIWLDGRLFSGAYILFSVLNTTAFGPRLKVAPTADTGDGFLDIFTIKRQNRDSLIAYLTSMVTEDLDELPSVEATSGKKIELEWHGFKLHVDAEVRPPEGWKPGMPPARTGLFRHFLPARRPVDRIMIEIVPAAVEFWLPRPDEKTAEKIEKKEEKKKEAEEKKIDEAQVLKEENTKTD